MIKNIIFDFGDIFINLNKKGTIEALSKLGINEISDDMITVYHQYEKGNISSEKFVAHFVEKFQVTKKQVIDAWNSVLLDFPKDRLTFLQNLADSKKYKLFLLSNTNELHIEWVKSSLGMDFYNSFKNCFHQFYLSHEIHFRKPDANIYEFVLNENNLIAEETLFVDDLKENTDAAKKLGINVWNLDPTKEEVIQLFDKNIIR